MDGRSKATSFLDQGGPTQDESVGQFLELCCRKESPCTTHSLLALSGFSISLYESPLRLLASGTWMLHDDPLLSSCRKHVLRFRLQANTRQHSSILQSEGGSSHAERGLDCHVLLVAGPCSIFSFSTSFRSQWCKVTPLPSSWEESCAHRILSATSADGY